MAKIHKLPERDPGVGLTQRQKRILDVIRHAVDRRGYPPSLREIGDSVGLTSPSSVAHQLAALERKGYLRRDPNPVSYTHLDVYKRQGNHGGGAVTRLSARPAGAADDRSTRRSRPAFIRPADVHARGTTSGSCPRSWSSPRCDLRKDAPCLTS